MKTHFNCDLNLDDETEANEFWDKYAVWPVRRVAKDLGFTGKDSTRAAKALKNYAINKVVACKLRLEGKIAGAISYERICDTIYTYDIQPLIECW